MSLLVNLFKFRSAKDQIQYDKTEGLSLYRLDNPTAGKDAYINRLLSEESATKAFHLDEYISTLSDLTVPPDEYLTEEELNLYYLMLRDWKTEKELLKSPEIPINVPLSDEDKKKLQALTGTELNILFHALRRKRIIIEQDDTRCGRLLGHLTGYSCHSFREALGANEIKHINKTKISKIGKSDIEGVINALNIVIEHLKDNIKTVS